MKNKNIEKYLYSIIGVLIMFLIIVAANFVLGFFKTRIDLTSERQFTLAEGTRKILAKLDSPVELRFYYTRGDEARKEMAFIKNYAQQVEDLLMELKQQSKGKIIVKKLDPTPASDAEDAARLDGMEGRPLPTGETFYLGLAISQEPEKASIPFLNPDRERLLEYDIMRQIARVQNPTRPVIGVMTPLPMFGSQLPPQMMMRMGQQGQEPWMIINELKQDFDVRQVPMDTDSIEKEIKVLLVVHPKDVTDKAQYAIDQFVMRGGRLIAFLDAMSLVDRPANPQSPIPMPGGPSNLEKLLKAWGITFENTKVVADMNFKTKLSRGQGRPPEDVATFMSLTPEGINREDAVTSQLDNIMFVFGGAFSGTPAEGLKQTVLLHTSKNSSFVDGFMATMSSEQINKEFKSSEKEHALAIRLTGKFKTAFPEGKPAEPKKDDDDKKDEKKDEKKEEKPAEESLKQSKEENTVILVGDSDMLNDQFAVRIGNFLGLRTIQYLNANLNLGQNIVEQLAGDPNLIGIRSRASVSRPFTVVQRIQAESERLTGQELKGLQEDVNETSKRLNELRSQKDPNQRVIYSKERREEEERLNKKIAETNKKIRELEKKRQRKLNSLEFSVKAWNIFAMPAVVALVGLVFGLNRARARAAR